MKIQDKAMIVTLNISEWSGRKLDKQATAEIEANHHARKAGNFNKILLAPEFLKPIAQIRTKARTYHNTVTLPWGKDGSGILPSVKYTDYTDTMRKFRAEFEAEIEVLINKYLSAICESEIRLGSLFDSSDYPRIDAIRKKFSFEISVLPIPASDDFRVQLHDDESKQVRENIERELNARFESANREVWTRLYDVVSKLSAKISDESALFKDSIIGNIRELVDILPAMNLSNDPNLYRMIDEVHKNLSGLDPDGLRKDKAHRKCVANTTDDILARMSVYMGEKPGKKSKNVQEIKVAA